MGAGGQTSQQNWSADDPGWHDPRVVGGELGLHPVEQILIDNRRDRDFDDLVLGFLLAGFR